MQPWTMPDAFMATEGGGAGDLGWPTVRPEARPGSIWWWPGSAVTREDLTWNLETYRNAGWGSMTVVGIYGVKGEEDRFIDIFTPRWFEMYNHAVTEAKRLGMNIDLTPSSGWRLGGPHITAQHAEQSFAVKDGRIEVKTRSDNVKRAGPGGKGLCFNPYSRAAVAFHFDWLARRFKEEQGLAPHAFYYDSFENPGNWCPELLDLFTQRRGYDLAGHARALGGGGNPDEARRVLCDYRETLSDALLECVEDIVRRCRQLGSGLRMQAHGAPANLLDMYAAAEFPETEVFGANRFEIPGYRRDPQWCRPDKHSPLVNRFASSAAHVAGRRVIVSESFTWLRNHYHTALSHIKAEADNLLLQGINGIYYHGVCFAPEKTDWPGWLFYASTQANARNSIFRDIPMLNAYITRCQSVLQESVPDNDVLLYWPVYDLWMGGGQPDLRFKVHNPDAWIDKTRCGEAAQWMLDNGYTFDFVSDRQLLKTAFEGASLRTEGGSAYRTILVPGATHMPLATARQLLELARAGATILVWKALPDDVPGWFEHGKRKQDLEALFGGLAFGSDGTAPVGKGKVVRGQDLAEVLRVAPVTREPMVDSGLRFIRRRDDGHTVYFIANHSAKRVDDWVSIGAPCLSAALLDPMTGRAGVAAVRRETKRADMRLQMEPGETRVLRAFADRSIEGPAWPIMEPAGDAIAVEGTWDVQFVDGGPELPAGFSTDALRCWTSLGDAEAGRFAGAARYSMVVNVPETQADGWVLDLGDVRESARVWIDGRPAGLVVAHPFRIDVGNSIRPGRHEIAVEVTNLSANRIRDLDRRGVPWKKFHDANIVDQNYKPFDASGWDLKPSGLLGPVRLLPYRFPTSGDEQEAMQPWIGNF